MKHITAAWRHLRVFGRHEWVLMLLLATLMGLMWWAMPQFVSLSGQLYSSRQLWDTAILALGMTLIIVSGGIDLSVGAAMGMCAVAFGICHSATGSVWLSSLACLSVGMLGGAVNGWLITWTGVHPLLVTLATLAGFRGIAEGISQGVSYSQFGDSFGELARGELGGIPWPALLFGLLAVGYGTWLARSPTGRYVYAIGHNERAARFSGISVDRIKFGLYLNSGLLAGLATLVLVSRFDTAKADAGTGMELDVITAVVIGGTSIFGGRGNVLGTVLGLVLIHETQLFVVRYWHRDELKSILLGLLLILSVLVYQAVLPKRKA